MNTRIVSHLPKAAIALTLACLLVNSALGQTVTIADLKPGYTSSSYEFMRFTASSGRIGGFMHNTTTNGLFGNGDDFAIYSYDGRDIFFHSGDAHIVFNYANSATGNVGIGTDTPDYRLDVNGTARAKEVIVESGWSDFVFEDDYDLPSLEEVERYIEAHGHLPEIPSAEEVQANGVKMGEMQARLLQKIEELTLYIIQQQEQLAIQQEQLSLQQLQVAIQQEQITRLSAAR